MSRFFTNKALAAVSFVLVASCAGAVAASERLPKAFHGKWTSDLAQCAETGESTPTEIDGRFILQYESGWTIRTWTRRGDVWVGRGTAGDDQGTMPATVRLRLRADGTLNFDSSGRGPFPNEPGLLRCPAQARPRG